MAQRLHPSSLWLALWVFCQIAARSLLVLFKPRSCYIVAADGLLSVGTFAAAGYIPYVWKLALH
jgi:hypothetical protein